MVQYVSITINNYTLWINSLNDFRQLIKRVTQPQMSARKKQNQSKQIA